MADSLDYDSIPHINNKSLDRINIISITSKIKDLESNLSIIRKDLNQSTRLAIQMKSTNKSAYKKSIDKCETLQRKFFNETKKVKNRTYNMIKEDEGELTMLSNKFDMLNDDFEKIARLNLSIESRLKVCEMEVGMGLK